MRADSGSDSDLLFSPSKLVALRGQFDPVVVCGKEKPRLTFPRYNVVRALLSAGDGGLSKNELEAKSGHPDAHKILRRLAKKDKDWGKAIQMAGASWCRYRIK